MTRPDRPLFVVLGLAAAAAMLAQKANAAGISQSAMPSQMSSRGIALLKNEEGFSPTAYPDGKDALGRQLYSIGYGHQIVSGDGLSSKSIVNSERAEQLLRADVRSREDAVRAAVRVPLNQNQYDALVMLSYNIGIGAFRSSTLVKRLNERNYSAAHAQFAVWNKADGKVNTVLVGRRQREAALFATA